MFKEDYPRFEQLINQQRDTWNRFSAGWKKWDELLMTSMKPVGVELINSLALNGNEKVLDVASGTGEPGLSLAASLPAGTVYGTDLSEKMVSIAEGNSHRAGISNYKAMVCDASDLPFEDNSFDHVICRFGIMFFPDLSRGLYEMKRVLKKGGRMSVAVWAAPELNPFITIMASSVLQKLELPAPPPDSPGFFRCAKPGKTHQLLNAIGMQEVTENELKGTAYFDSAQHYWDVMVDVAGPIMQALTKAPPETIDEVRKIVLTKAQSLERNGRVYADWEAIIASGIK